MGSRVRAFALLGVFCVYIGEARGDGLDAERFVPATGTEPGFHLEHPAVPFHLGWGLALFVNLADDPVVYRVNGDEVSRPLDTALTTDLSAVMGFFGWSELGIHLPLQLVYNGDDFDNGGVMLSPGAGVGDLRVVPKAVFVRTGSAARHFLLGMALPVSFPTGSDEALRGAGGVTVEPRLLAALHLGDFGLAFNAGYRWRAHHPSGLPWGDEIALAFSASYDVIDPLSVRAEVFGGKQVRTDTGGADFPMEILGGVVYTVADSWHLHGGASVGLTDGIGDPDFRVVLGLRYSHGVPERHGFGDSDGDGIIDKDDECPERAEDADGFLDEDGCPDPDNDHDGIADGDDECPDMPEEEGGDGDGCPDKVHVKIVDGKVVVFGKVQFRTGSSEIQEKSEPLLDQLATALQAHPQIETLRIEGHTDDVGDDDVNQKLSKERAKSVRRALIDRGVSGDRLTTVGHGETRPTAPNATRAGRAKNRRVEFIIVD